MSLAAVSDPRATVGSMSTLHDTATVDVCPICASARVLARETRWFALDLDRGDELRAGEHDVEFRCRDCGSDWD